MRHISTMKNIPGQEINPGIKNIRKINRDPGTETLVQNRVNHAQASRPRSHRSVLTSLWTFIQQQSFIYPPKIIHYSGKMGNINFNYSIEIWLPISYLTFNLSFKVSRIFDYCLCTIPSLSQIFINLQHNTNALTNTLTVLRTASWRLRWRWFLELAWSCVCVSVLLYL